MILTITEGLVVLMGHTDPAVEWDSRMDLAEELLVDTGQVLVA
jgi:hypothetical protein